MDVIFAASALSISRAFLFVPVLVFIFNIRLITSTILQPLKAVWVGILILIEFVHVVTVSVIPTHDLLGIVLDPLAMGTVSKAHAQAMRKEQLAALHLHPRAKICDDELIPRDYEDYDAHEKEPQRAVLAESRTTDLGYDCLQNKLPPVTRATYLSYSSPKERAKAKSKALAHLLRPAQPIQPTDKSIPEICSPPARTRKASFASSSSFQASSAFFKRISKQSVMFDSVSRTAASLFNVFHPKTFSLYLGGPGQVEKDRAWPGGLGGLEADEDQTQWVPMTMSEFKCACSHAMAIYGLSEDKTLKTPKCLNQRGLVNFKDILETDILVAHSKAEIYRPAHAVFLDRKENRIVVSIRGSVHYEDFVTDLRLMSPVYRSFSPDFSGFVHGGMLRAAQFVVESIHTALQLPECPEGLPILVTGHSLGGSVAALVAILLRLDARLEKEQRISTRAVCFSCVSVIGKDLSKKCRPFITTVVIGSDIFPRFHIESMNEIAKLSVGGFTPLRSLVRAFLRLLGKSRNVIMTGTLQAPRLYPAGALLWVLPPHRKDASSAVRLRPGKRVTRPLVSKPSAGGLYHGKGHHELRYVFPEAFEKLFVFKQAMIDHLPATYARVLDEVVEQQRQHLTTATVSRRWNVASGSFSSSLSSSSQMPQQVQIMQSLSDNVSPFITDGAIIEEVSEALAS